MKKMDDCCLLQLPYWTLLKALLEHYKEKNRLDSRRTPPTVQVNLVSSISVLLQQLYASDIKNRIEYLRAARHCLEILLSDYFALSYRPAYEHVSAAVDQVLTSLNIQLEESQQTDDLSELSLLAQLLLMKFDSQLVLAANQKKVFSSIVEKSLPKLLSVRRRMELANNSSNIPKIITEIICHALFHADTVLEFTSVLKDANAQNTLSSTNVKQTNYVVRLFETLEAMVSDTENMDQILDALDVVPVLFSSFLEAFRQKRNTSTSSLQDISRMAEFGLFVYLSNIIGMVKETAGPAYLKTLCKLLNELLQWNVYTARNDDIAKSQQEVLTNFADDIIVYIGDSKKYNQNLVFDLADILLQIDFSLIETRVQSLWPVLLNPEDTAQESCLKLAKSILNTYAASRQMDVFIQDLIAHIGNLQSKDIFDLLAKPMFSKDFLNEFSAAITKSMPAAQALGIFTSFKDCLIYSTSTSVDKHVAKKQKNDNNKKNNATATLAAVYLVEFTNSLRLNQHQLRSFEESLLSIYNDFVKACISEWNSSKGNTDCTILPALQVHSVLISTFFDTYFAKMIVNEQEWLAKSYTKIFQANLKGNTLQSRAVFVTCVSAMLQHVYYASLAQITSKSQTTDLVNLVVDYISSNGKNTLWYENTTWDGSLIGLETNDTVKLACWKLLTDEWFESVCRFVDLPKAKTIAHIIYTSMAAEMSSTTSISAQVLNTALLRSANFYEAQCFKSCNIQTIMSNIITFFSTKFSSTNESEISTTCAQLIAMVDLKKPIAVEQEKIESLSNLLRDKVDHMNEDIELKSTQNITEISSLVKLLCLFPIDYFERNERPQILYLTTLIDIWCVSCLNADPSVRMKLSLMCRSLQLRLIGYFSVNSVLGMNSEILSWLVSSNDLWPSEGKEDCKVLKSSLESVTNELDVNVLRRVIVSAGVKNPDLQSTTYYQQTLRERVEALGQNASKSALWKVINLLNAINTVLGSRKSMDSDSDNIVNAVEYISKISQHVILCLQDAKTFVSELLLTIKNDKEGVSATLLENNTKFQNIKIVFHLTRLLQEYAHIVGSEVDDAIFAEKISLTLTALASPFLEFLQFTLSIDDFENSIVLDMTTEFIAAFCSILSRYQKVETTKRVLAAIWFVYSLVLGTVGDEASIDILASAFGSWVQSLSKDQYAILIESFVEQSEEEANSRNDISKERHHLVFLSLFSLLLKNCKNDERGRLKKQIPSFILKLSLIAGKTCSLEYIQRLLKLLIQLTGDQVCW
ncbi:unnamed protein product [Mucor hiemalis]